MTSATDPSSHPGTQSTQAYSSTTSPLTPVPRAAVSVVVRYQQEIHHETKAKIPVPEPEVYYLLIERGNPPNKGVWCVPGGKIDMGEATLVAAQRELAEEVKFNNNDDNDEDNAAINIQWHEGAFCTSDSIVKGTDTSDGFHYLIAQCFAEVVVPGDKENPAGNLPSVTPADDAAGAQWWTLDQIKIAEGKKETVPNLVRVVERAEALYQCGMLPTTHSTTKH